MQKIKKLIFIIFLISLSSFIQAQAPYVVYSASKGVVLKSSKYGTIISPVRGTDVYPKDSFFLADERYIIKIKDTKTREIYEFSEKKSLTAKDIVDIQEYKSFRIFFSLVKEIGRDFGFDSSPKFTSQCVKHKGLVVTENQLSSSIAHQIEQTIKAKGYETKMMNIQRVYSEKYVYSYEIQNIQNTDYAFIIYTVGKDGEPHRHNSIIRKREDDGRIIPDEIEYNFIVRNTSLKLSFFSIVAEEDDPQTGYVILFNPDDLYNIYDSEYEALVNWDDIAKKLIYQGNQDRIIVIK